MSKKHNNPPSAADIESTAILRQRSKAQKIAGKMVSRHVKNARSGKTGTVSRVMPRRIPDAVPPMVAEILCQQGFQAYAAPVLRAATEKRIQSGMYGDVVHETHIWVPSGRHKVHSRLPDTAN